MKLQIAGINFCISSDRGLSLPGARGVVDDFMLVKEEGPHVVDVDVKIVVDNVPNLSGLKKVFEADDTWSLYTDGESKWFVRNHPEHMNEPPWVAKVDASGTDVLIYSHPDSEVVEFGQRMIDNPIMYPLDQLLLVNVLSQREGALIHSAAVHSEGTGMLLSGKSGAGKTTISNIVSEGSALSILSDDRIVIRKINGRYVMYGTPWPGEGGMAVNDSKRLGAIAFLKHAVENSLKELTPAEMFERLMVVASVPLYDEQATMEMMTFFDGLVTRVPGFELSFVPEDQTGEFIADCVAGLHEASL